MKLKDPKKVLPQLDLEVEETFDENTTPIVDGVEIADEDDTVFYFTNASDEAWTTQWNKVKYTFPAQRRTRMAIHGATPEEVQSIRKMFATRFANEQYYKTTDFAKRNKPVENRNPIAYGPGVLQPFIDSCLKPLPKAKLISEKVESDEDSKFSGQTRPLKEGVNPNVEFQNDEIPVLGEMPNN